MENNSYEYLKGTTWTSIDEQSNAPTPVTHPNLALITHNGLS